MSRKSEDYRGGGEREKRFSRETETTDDEKVCVRAKPKFKTAKSWAFGKGTYEPDPRNPGQRREQVGFIAFSLAEDNGDGTFTMPRWLVEREGLDAFVEG